jgi:hypothetical protein
MNVFLSATVLKSLQTALSFVTVSTLSNLSLSNKLYDFCIEVNSTNVLFTDVD